MHRLMNGRPSGALVVGWMIVVACIFLSANAFAQQGKFEGSWQVTKMKSVVLELRETARSSRYVGAMERDGRRVGTVRGKVVGEKLVGRLHSEGKSYDFKASVAGDRLVMVSGKKMMKFERASSGAAAAKAPPEVIESTLGVVEFYVGMLYERYEFKFPAKKRRAFAAKLSAAWPSMSAEQRAQLHKMVTAKRKLDKLWVKLDDKQKKLLAHKFQKQWVEKTTKKAKSHEDPRERAKQKKRLQEFAAYHKALAEEEKLAEQQAQAKSKKRKARKAALKRKRDAMADEMLGDSLQLAKEASGMW